MDFFGIDFYIYLFIGHAAWHADLSSFPDQGLNLFPLPWKLGDLTTGPPGKPFENIFTKNISWQN